MSTPKLIISLENKIVDEIPVEKEIITIGRRTDNDLCLDNLAISGYHSQISTMSGDCFLEDLDSTNGTFVNSRIIKNHALKDGDIIDIGNHRIKYVNHMSSNSANSEFEKTLVMTSASERKNTPKKEQNLQSLEDQINLNEETICDTTDNAESNVVESSAEDISSKFEQAISSKPTVDFTSNDIDDIQINSQSTSTKIGCIQILNGKNSGKEVTLDKSLTTVGKPDVAVVGITKRDNGYFIIHIDGNKNTPSKLNGEIIYGKAQPIENHDIIDVAGIKLEFFVE